MAELQIIGGAASNFVWVTRVACMEKGIAYTHVPMMPHTPEVDAIHPFGKIPVMRHGDVTLAESRAICAYIDRAFDGPPLTARDPVVAAQIEQWISIICTTIDPLWVRQYVGAFVVPGTPDGKPDQARINAAIPKMAPQFEVMDRAVATTNYLVGSSFTLADAYLTPILFYMEKLPESRLLLEATTNLKSYLNRQLDRPSVRATMSPGIPSARR